MKLESVTMSETADMDFRSTFTPEEPLHPITNAAERRNSPGELSTPLPHQDLAEIRRISLDRQQATSNGSCELKPGCLRLVKIHIYGETTDGLLHCRTQIFPIEASEKYTALSYAWGPPKAEHAIILDSKEHLLPTNLWLFLKTWQRGPRRSQFFSRWLWIDALCIDQANMRERLHQVKAMSRIFKGAEKVLVWLGPRNKMTELEFTHRAARHKVIESSSSRWVIPGISSRSYWSRLWVFQELKANQQRFLMCGDSIMRWSDWSPAMIEDGVDLVAFDEWSFESSDRQVFQPGIRDAPDIASGSDAERMITLCSGLLPKSLWLLMQLAVHLNCYDPRDKVYALLSLAETGAEGIEADYAMPLPQLMCLVLSNVHSESAPQSLHQVSVQCKRLKVLMGLEPDFPWGADEYLTAVGRPDLSWPFLLHYRQ